MTSRITQQELESYLWDAATLLRGTIDAGDYKQFIFPLLFYKRLCDVFDEETQVALKESGGDKKFAAYPENHRFQIPPDAHWREMRQTGKNVGQALQVAMRSIETANPEKLYGIFGDAQWSNKERLSDALLRDLVEHFNTLQLTIANLPEDELGQGYEYLIKKFADDSGHTAAEFYTNRTVVHLMSEMLKPQPGESIYDPTCGSGGMLLSSIAHLRRQGMEWRNVRLYGQERNLMTSSIARMNCFLHGIEDFRIERGDTLAEPKLVQGDHLQRFDVVLANPPYSIKQWDRDAFTADPWGRNLYGTPTQGRADYAFWQHILCSLAQKSGRCAILFPHGVLFRQEEAEMRRKIVEADTIECVLGLGPNLFYNSPMEACIVICRATKPKARKGKILFINAVNEVTRERAQSFLTDENIERIVKAYAQFEEQPGFTHVASLKEIQAKGGNLSIPLYVTLSADRTTAQSKKESDLAEPLDEWMQSSTAISRSLTELLPEINLPERNRSFHSNPQWAKSTVFDRKGWKTMPFGEFAESINERVEPANAGKEIYVGLDDIDSGSLRIRRWGKGEDVIGTKLRFRKDDLLFGRRRAYQRKLAVAEMSGICSAHAMVVRAKRALVLPEFLPFLMMSDHFMKRAVEISVGSLSPTINWTTLKQEKFALPPLDQQSRIADILWTMNRLTESSTTQVNAIREYQESFWFDHISGNHVVTTTVGHVAEVANGSTPSKAESQFWTDGTVPWLPTGKVHDRFIRAANEFITETAIKKKKARIFPRGSILVAMIGQGKTRGSAALLEIDASINQNFACVMPRKIDNQYLFYALHFSYEQLRRSSHGSNQEALNCRLVSDFPIPVADGATQKMVGSKLRACDAMRTLLENHIHQQRMLLNELLTRLLL